MQVSCRATLLFYSISLLFGGGCGVGNGGLPVWNARALHLGVCVFGCMGARDTLFAQLFKLTLLRVHPRDFVQLTHIEADEGFWVQVVKHKYGVVWGIVDISLIFVDWPQGKEIRFSSEDSFRSDLVDLLTIYNRG